MVPKSFILKLHPYMYTVSRTHPSSSFPTHTHPHTCTHLYTHTHTHLYTHTHTPVHTHTYTLTCPPQLAVQISLLKQHLQWEHSHLFLEVGHLCWDLISCGTVQAGVGGWSPGGHATTREVKGRLVEGLSGVCPRLVQECSGGRWGSGGGAWKPAVAVAPGESPALTQYIKTCDKTMNELLIQCKSLYTLPHACTKQLCTWPCSLTENISECRLLYPTQVFNVRQEVNKATAPEHAQANFSTRAVSILLLPHTSSPCTLP